MTSVCTETQGKALCGAKRNDRRLVPAWRFINLTYRALRIELPASESKCQPRGNQYVHFDVCRSSGRKWGNLRVRILSMNEKKKRRRIINNINFRQVLNYSVDMVQSRTTEQKRKRYFSNLCATWWPRIAQLNDERLEWIWTTEQNRVCITC